MRDLLLSITFYMYIFFFIVSFLSLIYKLRLGDFKDDVIAAVASSMSGDTYFKDMEGFLKEQNMMDSQVAKQALESIKVYPSFSPPSCPSRLFPLPSTLSPRRTLLSSSPLSSLISHLARSPSILAPPTTLSLPPISSLYLPLFQINGQWISKNAKDVCSWLNNKNNNNSPTTPPSK